MAFLHGLLEIAEDYAELWKLQSCFLLSVFEFVEGAHHRNRFHGIPLVCLAQDVVEFRDRTIERLISPARMASKHDVLRVRTSLKYSWAREAIADAISVRADGTTERHVFTNVDGDEPVRSIKDFVRYETASSHAQETCKACPTYSV
jgi:hypothetical protein